MPTKRSEKDVLGYKEYERTNIMFRLVFDVDIIFKYDQNNTIKECLTAQRYWSRVLFEKRTQNPLVAQHKNLTNFMAWFDQQFPSRDRTTN